MEFHSHDDRGYGEYNNLGFVAISQTKYLRCRTNFSMGRHQLTQYTNKKEIFPYHTHCLLCISPSIAKFGVGNIGLLIHTENFEWRHV